MLKVKVKDFISLEIPEDMEYSDNLDTQLFCALRRGEFAKEMEKLGIAVELEDPYSADRCLIFHSSCFHSIAGSEGTDFSNSTLRDQALLFMKTSFRSDELILLVDREDLIIGYTPCGEERNFHIHVATPKYVCYGQLWLNDIDEEDGRTEEAIRWLKTIEPDTSKATSFAENIENDVIEVMKNNPEAELTVGEVRSETGNKCPEEEVKMALNRLSRKGIVEKSLYLRDYVYTYHR